MPETPGWATPPTSTPPGPLVGWAAPVEPEGLGIGAAAREGWRLTRARLGTFAAITAVPMILLNLAILPVWISAGRTFESMITFWTTLDFERYRFDPEGLERDLQAAMQPQSDLLVLSIIGGGVAYVVCILAVAALTAATLDALDGRRPSFRGAYAAVGAHPGAIMVPALVLGIGYVAVLTPISLSQNDLVYGYGGDAIARATLNMVLALATLALEIVAIYLAIRWSLYFQAVIAEGHGLRQALSRSADLSRGVRIRIGLIVIVWSIVVGSGAVLVAAIAGLIAGVAATSFLAGLIAYSAVLSILGLGYFPFFVAMLTHVYGRRRDAESTDAVATDAVATDAVATDAVAAHAEPTATTD